VAEATRIEAYAKAMLEVARVEGHLADVEDELFRFARTFDGNDDLRMALSDAALPVERRIAVVTELLGAKALRTSVALVTLVIAGGRAGELPEIVDSFVEMSAAERKRAIAEVRSAIPLTSDQIERLRVALNQATDKDVEVKVVIDPAVLGGIVATIGDIVIDGSIRHRLDQLKEQL
jgi:F-type H+-transporting ATPase subunit delta